MREIKFRAWDKVNQHMVYQGWHREVFHTISDIFAYGDNVNLMQLTGLKDKNGVEIYEGDILKETCYVEPGYSVGESFTKVEYGDIQFSSTKGWNLIHVKGLDGFYLSFSHCEVIGNIYENKELLD